MSFLRVALEAPKRREQGFACGRGKWATAQRRVGCDIGTRSRLERDGIVSEQRWDGKLVHRFLLQPLGLELGRLDLGAKKFRGRAANQRGRRFQRAPRGAQG